MINATQKYKLSSEVVSRTIDDEVVLVDLKSEHYFGLNRVGCQVIEHFKEGACLDSIVTDLLAKYDVDKSELHQDIMELMQALSAAGLIQTET